MEENDTLHQQLNEIVYLLKVYCIKKEITTEGTGELLELDNLLAEIKDSLPKIKLDYSEPFIPDQKNSYMIPLKYEKAIRYMDKFNKYFGLNPQLTKIFKIDPLHWQKSIEKNEKVVLRLVEQDGILELAYLVNNEAYSFNYSNTELNRITNLSSLEDSFDIGIGKTLDKNLQYLSNNENINNTRKISINYYGNLDGSDFEKCKTIHLYPAIIDDITKENNHQFTFIMYFEPIDDNQIENKSNYAEIYYDTFQLCPPNC